MNLTPPASIREECWQLLLNRVHVLITNFEHLRPPPKILIETGVDQLIVDEAHRIRKVSAHLTQSIRQLKSRRIWILTGTPIEKDARDLAVLLSTLEPNRFSAKAPQVHLSQLKAQARKCTLRRLRSRVLPELPRVNDSTEILDLLPVQQKTYLRALETLSSEDKSKTLATINLLRTICDYDPETYESAKADRIMELLDDIRHTGEKAVVFSHFLKPLRILADRMTEAYGKEAARIFEGALSVDDRQKLIERFTKNNDLLALLCSTRAAGEGITLTAGNHVIFFNEWWNPSTDAQARDRVVRIGQERPVWVSRFRCRGSIEEVLESILDEKRQLFHDLVNRLARPSLMPEELLLRFVGEVRKRWEEG